MMRAFVVALLLSIGIAGTPGQLQVAAPPAAWPDTYQARLEALALMQTLNAEILASTSATRSLERWCEQLALADVPRIVADRVLETRAPDAGVLSRLEVGSANELRYRRVRLRCGTEVLSEADNWYVPARLTPEMNEALDTTNAPFGRVVAPLQPYRRTIAANVLWTPLPPGWMRGGGIPGGGHALAIPGALFEHRAVLYTRDHEPFSEVVETYQRAILGRPPAARLPPDPGL